MRAILFAAVLLAAPHTAAPPAATPAPVLVELFTSEGCSSCPPADLLLAKLLRDQPVAGAEIIPLSLHVDYWDHQGWKDPFAAKAYTARQQSYSKIFGGDRGYTPQMVIDGQEEFTGSDEAAALRAVGKAAARTHLAMKMDARTVGTGVRLSIDLPAAPADAEPIDVLVALTEDGLTSAVRRGENNGRTLAHVAVVRKLQVLGSLERESFVANGQIDLGAAWKPARMRAVAFLQGRTSKQVYGAATAALGSMTALLWLLLLAAQAPQAVAAAPVYVPQRVYDTRRQSFADFESMLADLAKADVIFVGEQHDDPNTHRLEASILDGLRRRGIPVTLSLEMFERDAQAGLDGYLAGTTSEEEFLKSARPWPRYATDYRALVEIAKGQKWPVLAANVPRRFASEVAKSGKSAIDAVSQEERRFVSRELQCPFDAYFDRFAESMTSHPVPGSEKLSAEERRANIERYYASQCLKDETMAESIAGGLERSGRGPVVHVNGSFHSDFGQGTAERTRRRLEGRRVAVVSILPVKDLDDLLPSAEDLRRADYLLYTTK